MAPSVSKENVPQSLIVLHALTGKWHPLQIMLKTQCYAKAMRDIGKDWSVAEVTLKAIEEFV